MRTTPPPRALRLAAVLTAAVAVFGCSDDDDASDSAPGAATSAPATGTPGTTAAVATSAAQTTAPPGTEPATTAAQTTAPPASEPATTASAEGVAYTSPEGDYTAVFPSQPTEQTQPQELPDGTVMVLAIAGVETEELFVGTARGQYPDGTVLDVPAALQGAQDLAIANVGGTLVGSRELELQGRPGRQFRASLTVNGQPGTLLQRVYFDGPVLYQNIVTGAGELTFQDPAVAAFFDSFRFTDG
jgi:hypothetical protein